MADTLFYGGDIITMEDYECEAVLIRDGIIIRIGDFDEVKEYAANDVQCIQLKDKTLMPAFIDAHGHFAGVAASYMYPSLKAADSHEEINNIIRRYIDENNIKPGEWVIAKGYNLVKLIEETHPKSCNLDEYIDNPVIVEHESGHMGVANSTALRRLSEYMDIHDENGLIKEDEYIKSIRNVAVKNIGDYVDAFKKAADYYLAHGITTVQEGMLVKELADIYLACKGERLGLDIIAYVDVNDSDIVYSKLAGSVGRYNNNLKIAGYKLFLDGSGSGCTAWLKEPYIHFDSTGNQIYSDEKLFSKLSHIYKENTQFIVHANGDAACEQLIRVYERVIKESGDTSYTKYPIIIHAMLLEKEQLLKAYELSMLPSFFIENIYEWGRLHIKNLGENRAERICIAKTAALNNIPFTMHADAPVLEPDMLRMVKHAVLRECEDGTVLGKDERLTVFEALKAVTKYAAYQYGEEEFKGTVREGKTADLVILSANPFKADIATIDEIEVVATYKKGKKVYKNNDY